MKCNYGKIELLEPIEFDKSVAVIVRLENNERVALTPLIYRSTDPLISKLVLLWELELTTKFNPRLLLSCKAQQEITVQLEDDNNKNKIDLKNIISSSHLHLEQIIQSHNNILSNYTPLYFNPDPLLEGILRLLQQPHGNPEI